MMKLETRYLMTLQLFADPPPATLKGTRTASVRSCVSRAANLAANGWKGEFDRTAPMDPQPNRWHDSARRPHNAGDHRQRIDLLPIPRIAPWQERGARGDRTWRSRQFV